MECLSQIVVSCYLQHFMVLYVFSDVAFSRSEGGNKALYFAVFVYLLVA